MNSQNHTPRIPSQTGSTDQGDLPPSLQRARQIILKYGRNATAYQLLNPGFQHWFSSHPQALVGFVRYNGVRIAAGDPVTETELKRDVALQFEEELRRSSNDRVCWFCASEKFATDIRTSPDHSVIIIGAQPVWDPKNWKRKVESRSSLRAQLRRAVNKKVIVKEWPVEKARGHPELEECLHQWLEARPFPPLHFLVEPQTLGRLFDRRIFVGERNGKTVGYVLLSPVPRRNGWLIEQFVRSPAAPNGTAELMITHAVETIAAEGYDYITLGLVPLWDQETEHTLNPPLITFLFKWLRLHGHRFYNFEGLKFFKAKFLPDYWESIYAVSNEPRFSLRTLYSVAAAFSHNSPVKALATALIRAVKQEVTWFLERLRSRGVSVS